MDDAAYKQLFSRPRMVRDLLRGFAARGWSGGLDFASLTPLPAGFVSRDLRQRHGDAVWRVRFHDRGGSIWCCCWSSSRRWTGRWPCAC